MTNPAIRHAASTNTTINVIGVNSRMAHFVPHQTVHFRAKYITKRRNRLL